MTAELSSLFRLVPLRRWKRGLLRSLGVPFHLQDVFLDQHRWSVTVSGHAIAQAGERYRQGDPKIIALEVLDALVHSRQGDRTPDNRHGAKKYSCLVWTPDQRKVYVLKGRKRAYVVVTALPTAWSEAVAEELAERRASRLKRPISKTRVALAFEEAEARRGN